MPTVHEAIEAALNEVTASQKRLAKIRSSRVRGVDEIGTLKATAQTWFYTHRPIASSAAPQIDLSAVDQSFTAVLDATEKQSAKNTYTVALKEAKEALIAARTAAHVTPLMGHDDPAPDFSPLVGNQQMRDILSRRWNECEKCVYADAHLAAIVMMGGLLEALFVARANKMPDKSQLTSSKNAPKEKATGKTINYQDWMLDSYIKVGVDLGWITESAKDVADKLKEYRNFIHPAKELRYGVTLGLNDSLMFWQVTKALTRQLLLSA